MGVKCHHHEYSISSVWNIHSSTMENGKWGVDPFNHHTYDGLHGWLSNRKNDSGKLIDNSAYLPRYIFSKFTVKTFLFVVGYISWRFAKQK